MAKFDRDSRTFETRVTFIRDIFSNKYQTMIEQIYMIFNIKVAKKELEDKQILTEVSILYYNSI